MSSKGSPREKTTDGLASMDQPISGMDAGSVDTQVTSDAQTNEVLNSENESGIPVRSDSTPVIPLPQINLDDDEDEEEKDTDRDAGQQEPTTTDADNETQDIIQKPELDSPPRLPDTFYYDAEQIHAKPITTNEKIFPENTLSMYRSFGYDCNKRGNLYILDNKTIMFVAGCIAELIDLPTGQHKYIRTAGGYSIGALVVHPSKQYFAVGEKGDMPNIVIYEYPSLRPYRILKGGTQRSYAYLDFNAEGDLLASLGSSPDYMLTIWDWRDEKILLRSKASSQEVFKVSFSKDLKGHLTTCGIGHIKFWKMARTFTGLKLQGELGRFGRTEISDIEGYRELPDGKVISGSEWGNMLLWDGGLIQIEVCQKKGKPCHTGPIQQVLLNESDVYTVGEDGYVRVWDFETIDTAEAIDEGSKMEMDLLNELRVGTDSKLMGITHGVVDDMSLWFAQDAKGNIWKLDLTFSKNSVDPEIILSFMSGAVTGLDVSSVYNIFASSAGNSIRVNNIMTQDLLSQRIFTNEITSLKWFPSVFDEKSDGILVGFSNGIIRYLKLRSGMKPTGTEKKLEFDLRMIQVLKPHTKAVTFITVEVKNQWIATGSSDGTVFFFNFTPKGLNPIGFVNVKEEITFMTWTPAQYDKTRLLVCLKNGVIHEYEGPSGNKFDTSTSYSIETQLPVRIFRFRSIKSRLRHEEELEVKRKEEEERQRKLEEERRLRGIEKEKKEGDRTDRTIEPEEEEKQEEDEWKPFIPETPSAALFAVYTSPDTFWLSMDDYDAGYLYHCQFANKDDRFQYNPERQDTVVNTLPVPNTDPAHGEDIPLTSILIREKLGLIFVGLKNGFIRVYPYGGAQIFQSLEEYWTRGSHDSEYGIVTHLAASFDDRFALSGGADGNIFGYVIKGDSSVVQGHSNTPKMPVFTGEAEVQDITEPSHYSIEEEKQKAEQDKMKKSAETLKNEMRQQIESLRGKFRRLLGINDQLPADLKMPRQNFILDENIRQNFQAELKEKVDLSIKELAWESERCNIALRKLEQWFIDPVAQDVVSVKSFDSQWEVSTFRTIELPNDFQAMQEEIERQKAALLDKTKPKETIEVTDDRSGDYRGAQTADSKVSTTKLKGAKAMRVERLLRKMEERSRRRQKRKDEWAALYNKKKPDGYDEPTEVENIRYARENMGNYFLKTASDYVVPADQRLTVLRALERIMKIRTATYAYKMKFNKRILDLIQRKRTLTEQINTDLQRLQNLGQNQTNNRELFNIPLLPLTDNGQDNRFQFTREEIQAFREEHEQRNGDLTKPDDDSSNPSARQSSLKRPLDLRWSVNLKEPLPSNPPNGNLANETSDDSTPPNILRQTKDTGNPSSDPFTYRLFFERDRILENVKEKMRIFDKDVCLLYYLKLIKTLRAKETDLRCITFYEELMLTKEFERTENELEHKVVEAQKRFDSEQTKLNEFQGKVDAKKKDIDMLDDRMKQLYGNFDEIIPREHKFYNYLLRVLNKKVKRKKRVEGEEADDADDMSQDLDEEEDWELEDDDDEDLTNEDPTRQLDVDICPPNLDQRLYDETIALREKRLDLEEAITDEKTVLQSLQQTLGQTQIYSNKVDAELKSKQADLIDFQKKKQRKINDINVAVGIRSHQIRYDRSTRLPDDLSESLIFNKKNKLGLTNRIVDVKTEIKRERERYTNKKQERKDLSHELKHAAQVINRLTDECNKLMVEKFGKLVELERIEGAIVNLQIEELKQRLDDAGDEYYNTMAQYELRKIEENDDTIDLLKTNTRRLDELTGLVDDKRHLDEQLISRKTKSSDEFSGQSKENIEEFDRLCTLVQLQAQEIEALKAEISILSRKGGHILPPNPAILPQNA